MYLYTTSIKISWMVSFTLHVQHCLGRFTLELDESDETACCDCDVRWDRRRIGKVLSKITFGRRRWGALITFNTILVLFFTYFYVRSSDDHLVLPHAIANVIGTTHILELKSHTITNMELFKLHMLEDLSSPELRRSELYSYILLTTGGNYGCCYAWYTY